MKKLLLSLILTSLVFTVVGCYSCQSWNNFWGTGPVEPYAAEKLFFDSDCKPIAPAAPAPKPAPKPRPAPAPKPVSAKCGPYTVTRTYPCGDCGVVRLDKTMPREVSLNAPFTYEIKVTNLTDVLVTDVVVTEQIDPKLKVTKSMPAARQIENKLVWMIDKLEPRQSKTVKVMAAAGGTECLKTCATMTYVVPACAYVQVVEPKLRLTKTAPAEVLLCDPIPVKMVVSNTGSGIAKDVKVTDTLPTGLMTEDGKRSVTLNAGTLAAGQSKQFAMDLKASKTGRYVNKAVAVSSDGLRAEATTTTVVRQPVLAIAKSGPQRRYLGRSVTYDITVSNKGDATAKDLVVEDKLPAGTTFVSSTGGGAASAGKVTWKLASLPAGQSRKMSVTVMPGGAGTITDVVTAKATCAEGVSATARTVITGISAVLLEVIDVDDPIEVGGNETYIIIATNQGSSDDTNIRIDCTLEANQQYVSSSGATRASAVGNKVTFAPLAKLGPKAKATWKVVVKAVKAGDVRFKVTMNTDQLSRPVEETEATHLYE